MGNFYANFTVRGQEAEAVANALAGRNALVTPVRNGCVVVFEEGSDAFDLSGAAEIAGRLSRQLECAVLAVLNYDDDVLCYLLFVAGEQVDSYDSAPGYFDATPERAGQPTGGEARLLCAAFGAPNPEAVDTILRAPQGDQGYAFAVDRHADLVEALGLPDFAVGLGYRYLAEGELPEGLAPDDLLRAPPQPAGVAGARIRSVLGLECWLKECLPSLELMQVEDFFVARLGEGGSEIPRPVLATNVVRVDFSGTTAGKGRAARRPTEESVLAPLHEFVQAAVGLVRWHNPAPGLVAVRAVLAKLTAGAAAGVPAPLTPDQRKSLEEELRRLETILVAAEKAGTQFLLAHEDH